MNSIKNTVAGSFALVAAFVTVAVATPLRAEQPVRVAVAYGDLDLKSDAGAAKLDARIRRAAQHVCGEADAASRFQVATCRSRAVKSAQGQLAMKSVEAPLMLASR